MRKFVLILFFAVSAPLPVLADRAEDVAAFNESWRAYLAAAELGDASATIESARAAVEAGRSILEATDSRFASLLINYGNALISGGRAELAQEVLKEALKLSEQIHGKDAIELIDVLVPLGDSVAEIGSWSRQLRYYNRSLDITERYFGRLSAEYGAALLRAATKTYDLSSTTKGMSLLRDAREVYSALSGAESADVGLVDYLLAKFEFSKGRHKKAVDYALEAVNKLEGESETVLDWHLRALALLVQAYEERNMTEEATQYCVAIGRISKLRPVQEHQPLFRLVPQYPGELLIAGVEGHVDFEFTVDEDGFVRDPRVINAMSTVGTAAKSTGSRLTRSVGKTNLLFEKAALEALERFRYAPMFVDGVATPVQNVQTRISFQIED